jgi:hypothetical protein
MDRSAQDHLIDASVGGAPEAACQNQAREVTAEIRDDYLHRGMADRFLFSHAEASDGSR